MQGTPNRLVNALRHLWFDVDDSRRLIGTDGLQRLQQRIVDLLGKHQVRSQTELAELLAARGVHVTQATLSRDLVELDAVKIRSASGPMPQPRQDAPASVGMPIRSMRLRLGSIPMLPFYLDISLRPPGGDEKTETCEG